MIEEYTAIIRRNSKPPTRREPARPAPRFLSTPPRSPRKSPSRHESQTLEIWPIRKAARGNAETLVMRVRACTPMKTVRRSPLGRPDPATSKASRHTPRPTVRERAGNDVPGRVNIAQASATIANAMTAAQRPPAIPQPDQPPRRKSDGNRKRHSTPAEPA
jgi:hypothetical protein